MLGTSPNIPIRSGGPQAGRINSMTLVQHNKQIIHNVAMVDIKAVEETRYPLMKWHISSQLFNKLDDFLPFVTTWFSDL